MMNQMTNAQRAQVLTHALPYIKRYSGGVLVIKYGGNAMVSDHLKDAVMGDIVLLSLIGIKVVLVHDGEDDLSVVGGINMDLVRRLQAKGGRAMGLCGIDGGMIKISADGTVMGVDTATLTDVIDMGYVPVISPMAMSDDGAVHAIDADRVATAIAGTIKAEGFISMTDGDGILYDKDDPTSLISVLNISDVPRLKGEGVIGGSMIPKVDCCVEAIRRGVNKVFIIDGRIPHSVIIETLTDEGVGTMFIRE